MYKYICIHIYLQSIRRKRNLLAAELGVVNPAGNPFVTTPNNPMQMVPSGSSTNLYTDIVTPGDQSGVSMVPQQVFSPNPYGAGGAAPPAAPRYSYAR